MSKSRAADQYSVQKTGLRRDAVIKRMLATPPKPHSGMKIGKSRRKAAKSPKGQKSQIALLAVLPYSCGRYLEDGQWILLR
jgi:hypothetical protein